MQKQFTNVDGSTSRAQLLNQSGGSSIWQDDDDDDDEPIYASGSSNNKEYTAEDLRNQQTRILDDQNQGLDALSKIISRQKDLAIKIGDEVDVQNGNFKIFLSVIFLEFPSFFKDIIDDLAFDIDRTDSRINSETRHVRTVSQSESSTWGYWIVIISLFVLIIVVAFL